MKTNCDTSTDRQVITSGNRAVVIKRQGGSVWANVYVNARNGLQHADITLLRWTGKTMEGAVRWANKHLGE